MHKTVGNCSCISPEVHYTLCGFFLSFSVCVCEHINVMCVLKGWRERVYV